MEIAPDDARIKRPLAALKNQFFDKRAGIYSLQEDHFPIPCLNGNMVRSVGKAGQICFVKNLLGLLIAQIIRCIRRDITHQRSIFLVGGKTVVAPIALVVERAKRIKTRISAPIGIVGLD